MLSALLFSNLLPLLAAVLLGIMVLLCAALFGKQLRYHISETNSEDNTSAAFAGALEALTDSRLNRSTQLQVLTNGPEFYEAELSAIAAAQRSVCLEAYLFYEGQIAQRYVDALTERARAGVPVKVVLDAVGSARTGADYFRTFKAAGGKLVWYNPARLKRIAHLDNRTHRELLVTDGKTGFIGGAGIADEWYTGSKGQPRWRDTMVRVTGTAVANLQATFAENWLEGCSEILIGEEYFPEITSPNLPGGDPSASTTRERESGNQSAMVVSSGPTAAGSTRARILFQLLIASAKKTIHINTPYLLPDQSLADEFARAVRKRGVQITLIVPGRRSDLWLTRTSSRRKYGKLLQSGLRIFEYQPAMIHAKILLIDGLWGVVGSTNLDYRSFRINDEVNLAVRDANFVARLAEDFAKDLANSREITYEKWSHRGVFERVPEFFGGFLERQE